MANAGLDPSRIRERALLLEEQNAKRKRKWEEDKMDVDDGAGIATDGDSEWMDVDEEGGDNAPRKRAKANSGAVVAYGREPRRNRQLAGMRVDAVSFLSSKSISHHLSLCFLFFYIASIKGYQVA
jgi:nucleolar GTP-binding protein